MHTKLPHISLQEYYQFITFRTQDSVDTYITKIYENNSLSDKQKQYQIDKYLDTSNNGAYLYGNNIDIVKDIVLDNKKKDMYEVDILCVMPNHVHMLIKQKDELANIMRYIKGKSAVELNKSLAKSGKFWLSDYFDKLIRDEKHYELVYQYISDNPIKAELADWESRVYSRYE